MTLAPIQLQVHNAISASALLASTTCLQLSQGKST